MAEGYALPGLAAARRGARYRFALPARSSYSEGSPDAGWSSSVARWAHNPEVEGSNPSPATKMQVRGPFSNRERASCVSWPPSGAEPDTRRGSDRSRTCSCRHCRRHRPPAPNWQQEPQQLRLVVFLPGSYIARCSNRCYGACMSMQPEITQRDLRMRSKEIMDAVERGQAFTVTRDGHRIGELVPLRQRRRFVSRAEFTAMSRGAPAVDVDAFRADQDAAADQAGSAYDR